MNGIKTATLLVLMSLITNGLTNPVSAQKRDYRFEGRISREVLENYLSRAVTFSDLLDPENTKNRLNGSVEDNIRFLKNVGAKFAGRALFMWGRESRLPRLLDQAKPVVKMIHQADPDMILQAAAFEIITSQVNQIPIPPWVFEEFEVKVETRNFRYDAMLYPDGKGHNHWRNGSSIPDMSRLETRMWFYFLSASYIQIGIEAIHFGQVEIMDNRDPHRTHWQDMLARVRKYAAKHARRKMLLCDAHVPSGGIVENGKLLFDFHSFPLRIEEVPDQPGHGILQVGYLDSIFNRSKGGITPSGWKCKNLPYLAEVDNFGSSRRGGQNIGAHWCWGYDEICWFAHQPEAYRNQWLRYAWKWIRQTDPAGFLQMPASRTLADPVDNVRWYYANTRSEKVPHGFNQESTIKSIWNKDLK
jgi:hypothetical protein